MEFWTYSKPRWVEDFIAVDKSPDQHVGVQLKHLSHRSPNNSTCDGDSWNLPQRTYILWHVYSGIPTKSLFQCFTTPCTLTQVTSLKFTTTPVRRSLFFSHLRTRWRFGFRCQCSFPQLLCANPESILRVLRDIGKHPDLKKKINHSSGLLKSNTLTSSALLQEVLLPSSFLHFSSKWWLPFQLDENGCGWIMLVNRRRSSHCSSRVLITLVNKSASYFLVSTFFIWILAFKVNLPKKKTLICDSVAPRRVSQQWTSSRENHLDHYLEILNESTTAPYFEKNFRL